MVCHRFLRWSPFQRAFPIARILPNLPDREPLRSNRYDFQRYLLTNMMDFSPRCVSLKAGLWPGQGIAECIDHPDHHGRVHERARLRLQTSQNWIATWIQHEWMGALPWGHSQCAENRFPRENISHQDETLLSRRWGQSHSCNFMIHTTMDQIVNRYDKNTRGKKTGSHC